jgi:hypothetical protein
MKGDMAMLLSLEVECDVDDLGGALPPEEAQFLAIVRTMSRIARGDVAMVAVEGEADLVQCGLCDGERCVGTVTLRAT